MLFPIKRASIALLSLLAVILLVVGAIRLFVFIHIFGSHAGIALTQEQVLKAHNDTAIDERPQLIPKIIHQIFHNWKDPGNTTLPSHWEAERQTCLELNPDWEYRLWTGEESREFIKKEYPWFLSKYDGYRFPVQRVDGLKYLLMRHFGGVYLDLDNGCTENLTPLLYYPAFVTDGGHGTLSNNIVGAQPNHPFWTLVTESLIPWGWDYLFPYMTIHYGSGQWFETAIWEKYHHELSQNGTEAFERGQLHRIMMDMRPGAAPWVFFSQARGGSWDNWDNHLFGWIGNHVPVVALSGALATVLPCLCIYACIRWRRRRNQGYALLRNQQKDDDIE